jgi:hypothetical protein
MVSTGAFSSKTVESGVVGGNRSIGGLRWKNDGKVFRVLDDFGACGLDGEDCEPLERRASQTTASESVASLRSAVFGYELLRRFTLTYRSIMYYLRMYWCIRALFGFVDYR